MKWWHPKRRLFLLSGYHAEHPAIWQSWFHALWWRVNVEPILDAGCERVFILATKGSYCAEELRRGHWLWVPGNLGHADDIALRGKNAWCPGCPATWLAGAWLAYASECDLLYVEQDALCFGDWLNHAYRDMGDKQVVFGSGKLHGGSSTSLFIVRHSFIPKWTHDYLSEGREDVYQRFPERKMFRLRQREPENYAELSFGHDTDRPFNPLDPTFYVQKTTPKELFELKQAGRLDFSSMPDTPLFSNHE